MVYDRYTAKSTFIAVGMSCDSAVYDSYTTKGTCISVKAICENAPKN